MGTFEFMFSRHTTYEHPLVSPVFYLEKLIKRENIEGLKLFRQFALSNPAQAIKTLLLENENHQIPLELVAQVKNPLARADFYNVFLWLIFFHNYQRELNEPVVSLSVDMPLRLSKTLELNLRYATAAANAVRQEQLRSTTHSSRNGILKKDYEAESFMLNVKRTAAFSRLNTLLQTPSFYNSYQDGVYDMSSTSFEEILKDLCYLFKLKRCEDEPLLANCYELSILALNHIFQQQWQTRVEMVAFKNGDHVFIVIGRPDSVSLDNLKNSTEAVICDPWNGVVFPAKDLEVYLQDLKCINIKHEEDIYHYNLIVPYQAEVHSDLEKYFDFSRSEAHEQNYFRYLEQPDDPEDDDTPLTFQDTPPLVEEDSDISNDSDLEDACSEEEDVIDQSENNSASTRLMNISSSLSKSNFSEIELPSQCFFYKRQEAKRPDISAIPPMINNFQ